MSKKELASKASDNKYLHRDFHVALNIALNYLSENFGQESVEEYLIDYSNNYFTPKSLAEIKEYLISIYKKEEAEENIVITEEPGKLNVEINKCPALEFIKTPSKFYKMTTEVVCRELAKISGLKFTMHRYDEITGAANYTFEEVQK